MIDYSKAAEYKHHMSNKLMHSFLKHEAMLYLQDKRYHTVIRVPKMTAWFMLADVQDDKEVCDVSTKKWIDKGYQALTAYCVNGIIFVDGDHTEYTNLDYLFWLRF